MPMRECRGMAGRAYHVMNRATCGQVLFDESEDYVRFLCTLQQARAKVPIRLLSYCLMPNHWHLVLWPAADDDVMRFTHWLTGTHAQRVHARRGTKGRGAIYAHRYGAVPVNDDAAFLRVVRYVERNAVRAQLVERAQDWLWSSACARLSTRTRCRTLAGAQAGDVDGLPQRRRAGPGTGRHSRAGGVQPADRH